MPAYAKITLVRPMFHPSDLSFAQRWSEAAPGWGNWRILLDKPEDAETVSVIPPGVEDPVFFIHRHGGEVVLERQPPGGARTEVGRFRGLRDVLLALCPLDGDTMEDIQLALERDFPRSRDD